MNRCTLKSMPYSWVGCVLIFCTSNLPTALETAVLPSKPIAHAGVSGKCTSVSAMAVQPQRINLVRAGDDLQAALNSAVPGDTLVLQSGAEFDGNFVLPAGSSSSAWITVTSDATDLPGAGVRVGPSNAASMPKILSSNSLPAIRTAPGSQFVQMIGIEVGLTPEVAASDGLILLGDGSAAQKSLDQVPHDFLIDRCYVHGNPISNSKRGIALNCLAAAVQNSYISDFHAVGFDTQAIGGWNGPGPFTISNNYLEASGENVMFGGADPSIPNLIPSDIVFRHNLVSKPIEWMSGILAKTVGIAAAPALQAGGGLVEETTYYYRVSATASIGAETPIQAAASSEVMATPGPGHNAIALAWSSVPEATGYLVYRTSDPPLLPNRSWIAYSVDAQSGATDTFTDIGAPPSVLAAEPAELVTRWSVKNLFELKNSSRVLIDGNIFQNNWLDAQTGYAISFKSVNQDGTAPWSSTSEVTFTNNVVRNSASALTLQGTDPDHHSGQTCCILIRNNVFYRIDGPSFGGEGTFLKITGLSGCVIDHNTTIQSGNLMTAYGDPTDGFIFSNNIAPGNLYGIKGDGTASGNATVQTYFPSGLLKRNVIVLTGSSSYPRNNYYPFSLDDIGFIDLSNLDLRLSGNSPFLGAGTKGSDVGADVNKINRDLGSNAGPD